jgi:Holliday junction resolvase RusA-like endonuclease
MLRRAGSARIAPRQAAAIDILDGLFDSLPPLAALRGFERDRAYEDARRIVEHQLEEWGPEPDVRLQLPIPPSANALFTNRAGTTQRIKTNAYRAWVAEAGWAVNLAGRPAEPIGRCRIEIDLPFNRTRDIDNAIKPVADLMVRQRVIVDDRWVDEYLVRRVPATEALEVTIWRLG